MMTTEPERAPSARTLVVDQAHAAADDANAGTPHKPLRSIAAAAARALSGDTVLIMPGIYRERVSPAHGGEPGRPVVYRAGGPRHRTILRGSDPLAGPWRATGDAGVFACRIPHERMGSAAYAGLCDPRVYGSFDPYQSTFDPNVPARPMSAAVEVAQVRVTCFADELARDTSGTGRVNIEEKLGKSRTELAQLLAPDPRLPRTLGQIFVDGLPLTEVERSADLGRTPGSWQVDAAGEFLLVHLPDATSHPEAHLIEHTVRHTVFAPLRRGLGWIEVRGLVIEHGANHCPGWGSDAWPQVGILSCRSGHHWTIDDCVIRHAKGIGIDIGQEGGREVDAHGEHPEHLRLPPSRPSHAHLLDVPEDRAGHHVITRNHVCDNGLCGIAGIMTRGVRIAGNVIERNNRDGWTSPWWEYAGIKLHYVLDAVIEGNLIRDNDAHGIWLDNQFAGTRVTRNVIVNNLWSGINLELGRGPVTVDHNVIAHTRNGDGIYGHDVADILVAHNLLYANAGHGAWFAWCTPRVRPEDGCWDIRILNNLILGNRVAAVGLPLPWTAAGRNRSDANLLMGSGVPLDEGSGPFPPRFVVTNTTHCAQYPAVCPGDEVQTSDVVTGKLARLLDAVGLTGKRPDDLARWPETFQLPLDLWQAAMDCERASVVIRATRDGLQTHQPAWWFPFDGSERQVACQRLPGLDRDFHGLSLAEQPLPGPFQDLHAGANRIVLWPIPGVPAIMDVG